MAKTITIEITIEEADLLLLAVDLALDHDFDRDDVDTLRTLADDIATITERNTL